MNDELKAPKQEATAGSGLSDGLGAMLTERQLKLITTCKEAGWGWRKFAKSVEVSGNCTPMQEDTLCLMTQRISCYKARRNGHFNRSQGGDWDSHNLDAASNGYASNDIT